MKPIVCRLGPAALASAMILSCTAPQAYTVPGGAVLPLKEGVCHEGGAVLRLTAVDSAVVRMEITADTSASRQSLIVVPQDSFEAYRTALGRRSVTLETPLLKVKAFSDGGVRFRDKRSGRELLRSLGDGLELRSVEVEGKDGYAWKTVWSTPGDGPLYGLGQQQTLRLDHRGEDEDLFQYNTKISVPFIAGEGWALLWDSYSQGRWGNPECLQIGEVFKLYDKEGRPGSLTGTYQVKDVPEPFVRAEDSLYFENEQAVSNLPPLPLKGAHVEYDGYIEADKTGDYHFILYYAGYQKLSIGGEELVPERWRAAWNPNSYRFTAHLRARHKTPIHLEWLPDGDVSYLGLRVSPLYGRQNDITISAEMDSEIDFYFMAGRNHDELVGSYRRLTGRASLLPLWAFGFWQSRERYVTQDEIVGTAREMRERGIPFDNIVQDWQYWASDQWGSHEFEASRFPDPEAMLDEIHSLDARYMISVWPKFYANTAHYQELDAAGHIYPHAGEVGLVDWLGHRQSFYDAYSAEGREIFWRQMDESLYSRYGRKIDAWWMDASEPNLRDCLPMPYFKSLITPTALGPSTEYLNAYSLVNADAIYNGQRGVEPDRRVFLLTRNGFPGLQRYSTASWSGDIGTSWLDMEAQMAAGLGYCMSGLPYWGMDIGGFSVQDRFSAAEAAFRSSGEVGEDLFEWRELQTRWHQFGAFVPIFRTHGQWPWRELWNIDPSEGEAYNSILYYMRMRYRLMPYIYSLAAAVHFDDYTMMRSLSMDFPADKAVAGLYDQWMFGPALMPCPVYGYKARERKVHLPSGSGWYDFASGARLDGAQDIVADAPLSRMPLYVREGSVIPLGPAIESTARMPSQTLDIVIYAGADGHFSLYEDDGVSYGYERGEYSRIDMDWNDSRRELSISDLRGAWPAMPAERVLRIHVVDASHPLGYDAITLGAAPALTLHYKSEGGVYAL